MHPLYEKADRLGGEVIGAAIEVHRHKGAGLKNGIFRMILPGANQSEENGDHEVSL